MIILTHCCNKSSPYRRLFFFGEVSVVLSSQHRTIYKTIAFCISKSALKIHLLCVFWIFQNRGVKCKRHSAQQQRTHCMIGKVGSMVNKTELKLVEIGTHCNAIIRSNLSNRIPLRYTIFYRSCNID